MPNEEVYLMQCHPGWGEALESDLDELQVITPETISDFLKKTFPKDCQKVNITDLAKWLQEMRSLKADVAFENPFVLFQEEECDKCGNDSEISYEIQYERLS